MTTTADHLAEWWSLAACQYADPDLFFPISAIGPRPGAGRPGRRPCAPAARCGATAFVTRWPPGPLQGVWGGMNEEERRLLRQREAKARMRAVRRAGPASPAPRRPRAAMFRARPCRTARASGPSKGGQSHLHRNRDRSRHRHHRAHHLAVAPLAGLTALTALPQAAQPMLAACVLPMLKPHAEDAPRRRPRAGCRDIPRAVCRRLRRAARRGTCRTSPASPGSRAGTCA